MDYKETLDKIEKILQGNAHLDELAKRGRDPFKVLISTILSARTKDANTKAATDKLFAKYNTPRLIAQGDIEELEKLIRQSGFYRVKAARIKDVSNIIMNDYNGVVPEEYDELVNLPGVGAKTANCVLVYGFNIPAIPVDTHVHGISNRLGWVQTKKPEQTEKALSKIIPKEQWIRINRTLVKFGQQICVPINPKHQLCPVEDICPKNFTMENEMKKARERRKNQ